MRVMLKGKIHRACVTSVNIGYEGSISIDKKLMEEADILPYEKVHVLNVNNGTRFETYAVEAEPGSGEIGILGAAARLATVGDTVIIISYSHVDDAEARHVIPRIVHVDANNAITRTARAAGTIAF